MKFRFDDQPHQSAAVSAVVDLFEGALVPPRDALAGQAPGADGHAGFTLERSVLTDNLTTITAREAVEPQAQLELLAETDLEGAEREFPNFSVEMETGTGKTYVLPVPVSISTEKFGNSRSAPSRSVSASSSSWACGSTDSRAVIVLRLSVRTSRSSVNPACPSAPGACPASASRGGTRAPSNRSTTAETAADWCG